MAELQALDLNRLLLGHAILSLVAGLSDAPVWNLPLALYGLVVAGKTDSGDGGDSVRQASHHASRWARELNPARLRQFAALFGVSFLLDFFWLTSHGTNTFVWFMVVANFILKASFLSFMSTQETSLTLCSTPQPISLLSSLGHLRQRGEATFNLPGGFSLPGSFGGNGSDSMPGGFPPRANETGTFSPSLLIISHRTIAGLIRVFCVVALPSLFSLFFFSLSLGRACTKLPPEGFFLRRRGGEASCGECRCPAGARVCAAGSSRRGWRLPHAGVRRAV